MSERDESIDAHVRDAFCRHDAVEVRRLLSGDPALRERINEPVFSFNSPAIVAFADDPAMVEVLLEFGADPNKRSEWWAGPFHALYSATGVAAERLIAAGAKMDACAAAHLDRADVLRQLLAADPKRVHERGGDGQTPLHFARSRAVVDLLLAAGADINARDVDHRANPAEWMLERTKDAGRFELARYLVERGAAADIFLLAALGLRERAVSMIEDDKSLLDLRTGRGEYGEKPPSSYHIYFWTIGDGRSPIDVAVQFAQRETAQALLAFASLRQRLLFACRQGDGDQARAILHSQPSIIQELTGDDARAMADAAWNGDARAVALMLELGFDPRIAGHDAGTPLHLAAWEGSPETVSVLLRHPDARELVAIKDAHYGATPLGWCCHGSVNGNLEHDHAEVARLLLRAGAELSPDAMEAAEAVRAILDNVRANTQGHAN